MSRLHRHKQKIADDNSGKFWDMVIANERFMDAVFSPRMWITPLHKTLEYEKWPPTVHHMWSKPLTPHMRKSIEDIPPMKPNPIMGIAWEDIKKGQLADIDYATGNVSVYRDPKQFTHKPTTARGVIAMEEGESKPLTKETLENAIKLLEDMDPIPGVPLLQPPSYLASTSWSWWDEGEYKWDCKAERHATKAITDRKKRERELELCNWDVWGVWGKRPATPKDWADAREALRETRETRHHRKRMQLIIDTPLWDTERFVAKTSTFPQFIAY